MVFREILETPTFKVRIYYFDTVILTYTPLDGPITLLLCLFYISDVLLLRSFHIYGVGTQTVVEEGTRTHKTCRMRVYGPETLGLRQTIREEE